MLKDTATVYTFQILSVVVSPKCFLDLVASDALMFVLATTSGRIFPLNRRVLADELVLSSDVDRAVLLVTT